MYNSEVETLHMGRVWWKADASCFEGQGIKVKIATSLDVNKSGTPRLWKYNSSEIETLHVGRVWWEVDAHPVFGLD